MIEGEGGVAERFGFQAGDKGGSRCAGENLTADLASGGGHPVPALDAAIAALHEQCFENYNEWALMIGARPVYSARLVLQKVAARDLAGRHVAAALAVSAAATGPVEVQTAPSPGIPGGEEEQGDPDAAAAGTGTGAGAGDEGAEEQPEEGDGGGGADITSQSSKQKRKSKKHRSSATSSIASGMSGRSLKAPLGMATAAASAAAAAAAAAATGTGADGSGGAYEAGADVNTRLYELCLLYCIRAEAANLRFMPE